MSRLDVKTLDLSQAVVNELYKDFERRVVASPQGLCPVDMAGTFLRMSHAQTCGKCVPCRVGLGQLEELIEKVLDVNGNTTVETIDLIEETAEMIRDAADCAIGTEAANMVLRGVKGFREDYIEHIKNHKCSENVQKMKLPVPCVGMCPANVDVPGYVALIAEGRSADAVRVIRKDNPFPSACALICEHPCEARCRRTFVDSPIHIRGLKKFAIENAGSVPPPQGAEPTGKKIAIIGGGPSGLTTAYFLSLMGHSITVLEKREQLGGMLRYGIPSYRLPRERLQSDIDTILATGVEVKTGVEIGSGDYSIEKLRSEYDAVYVSIGAHSFNQLGIPGEDARGVIPAVEMLRGIGDSKMPDYAGKVVCVIGGGNVAMDVVRTAKRLGAKNASLVYRRRKEDMTALPEEIEGAIAEGCDLITLMAPDSIEVSESGDVRGLWVKPQLPGLSDASGRPRPVNAKAERVFIPCDLVLSAIGQAIDSESFAKYGIPVNRGNIVTMTSCGVKDLEGVFAGGDCVTGPSTVINAIMAGKVAAANIDSYLGFNHPITCDVEIPKPRNIDRPACGRAVLTERHASERIEDFDGIENPMSEEAALQEALRCLRCDCSGFGSFRGGREKQW
ncbi:MAG: NAD(P)-binding protein [Eubacteriales bacterium]|nr:NAD(P)-binding protein [Eubacteriales bacterium]MDD3350468.1 NAD(P)-binding protein [Eubacteriales bacterium]